MTTEPKAAALAAVTETEQQLRARSDAAEQAIVAAYLAGASLDEIATASAAGEGRGRSIETVRTLLRRNKVPLRPRGRRWPDS